MGVDGAESGAASVGAEGLLAGPAAVGMSMQKWWGEGGAESETPSAGVVAESASEMPSAGVVAESASASVGAVCWGGGAVGRTYCGWNEYAEVVGGGWG